MSSRAITGVLPSTPAQRVPRCLRRAGHNGVRAHFARNARAHPCSAYGRDVFFLTGADEHGQKIADTAATQGLKPIELVNKCVAQFKHLDWTLGCDFDGCVR